MPQPTAVKITLDRERAIVFTMGAARRIKQEIRENVLLWEAADWQRFILEPDTIAVILWATLFQEDKKLTPDSAAELMDTAPKYQEVVGALMKAWVFFSGLTEQDLDEAVAKAKADAIVKAEAKAAEGEAPANPQTATA